MNAAVLRWHPYRYFPYERDLAKLEVEKLAGASPQPHPDGMIVELNGQDPRVLGRLTYFSEVVLPTGELITTEQQRMELSVNRSRDGDRPPIERARLTRQRTRYSVHGLHEYKGKFNPQVVRALGNLMGLGPGARIMDPFCGSGTVLAEAAHLGWDAVGLDLNPLAVEIANSKVAALRASPRTLSSAVSSLVQRLESIKVASWESAWSERKMAAIAGKGWEDKLPHHAYLSRWFPQPVLSQAVAVLDSIETLPKRVQPVFRIILSDVVRDVSWQDPGDLRIRRRKDPSPNYPLIPLFLEDAEKKTSLILAARRLLRFPVGHISAVLADSRDIGAASLPGSPAGSPSFDAAITSPPYATALPYIDTQRLSLCLLGLLPPPGIRAVERELIGDREIGVRERESLEAELRANTHGLPRPIVDLCSEALAAVGSASDGFRRKNTPALLYRYFMDMSQVISNALSWVVPGGSFALVVGRNRTRLGGRDFLIDTPDLLALLASARGWRCSLLRQLDTYQRYEVHQRNSIRSESLMVLEKPSDFR